MLTKKFKKGKTYNIKGLDIHIPPVGYVYNRETGELEPRSVHSRSSNKKDQYWERQGYIEGYDKLRAEERRKQAIDPSYEDPTLAGFRMECWDRRINGMWFMNNGEPTYITGMHWFYLEWIHIKNTENAGYPFYWESDKEFFWFLQYVIDDPNALGMVYVTRRREGKSSKSVAFLLDAATRIPNANCGIQSKTDKDAKIVVYQRGVIDAFSKLPDFFKPVYDMSAGSKPKNGLYFVDTPTKGRKSEESQRPELGGSITYRASTESAYDGEKLTRYVGDEIFKSLVDIEERHRVVRFCLTDYNGNWDGKALYTSTVEEMEGYIDDYINFWDKSNQADRGQTGKTKNGLYRYFLSSDEAMNRDQYGKCDMEGNRNRILSEREFVRSDADEYNSIVRKQPLTIEEAFRTAGKSSMFDTIKIADRLEKIQWMKDELYDVGNFYWKDNKPESETVEWRSESNGRFKIRWSRCGEFEPNKKSSLWADSRIPGNTLKFVAGCDPYDHGRTTDGRGSKGAFMIMRKYDINDIENSETFCVSYKNRPPTPQIFYEDVLLACVYFGCEVLVENNKLGIITHIEKYMGYGKYLMWLYGRKAAGIPASDSSKDAMSSLLVKYFHDNIGKIDFIDLLRDAKDFDLTNTRKSDLTMAAGWTLMADKKILVEQQKRKQEQLKKVDVHGLFSRGRRRRS